MNTYLKKYSITLIALYALKGLITAFIILKLPELLFEQGIDYNKSNEIVNSLTSLLFIPMNLVVAMMIWLDMVKLKIKSISLVLLSIISSIVAVIFFFLLIDNKLKSNGQH